MTWLEIPRNPSTRTLRQFAVAWLLVLVIVGGHRYYVRGQHTAGTLYLSMGIVFGLGGLFRPSVVRWLFVGCSVAAYPIGWVLSQVLLLALFYGLITPLALLLRLKGRDPLGRKKGGNQASFWSPKPSPKDFRSYFRPY
jgi:hypothetical protein